MSFSIILQNNASESNRIGKTITNIVTLSGTLKNDTSIINPVILIESTDISNITSKINYMSISTFGRCYFITGIKSICNNLWEISAHVDVLESYKSQIKANKGVIFRQEKEWNLYLDDGTFKCYQNPIIVTKKFPNGFTGQDYILTVAGN